MEGRTAKTCNIVMFLHGAEDSLPSYIKMEPSIEGSIFIKWWAEVDSNHRSLATTDLQSVPFSHSGIYPFNYQSHIQSH